MASCTRPSFTELSTTTLYEVLRLRSEVFVVEQACAYGDLDGRDREPATRHLWIEDGGTVVAYLRVLDDGDGAAHRPRGDGPDAPPAWPGRPVGGSRARLDRPARSTLDAQSYLRGWYEAFGFRVDGPEFLDDGIPHVPMRLDR